jgi:hypothetical protein
MPRTMKRTIHAVASASLLGLLLTAGCNSSPNPTLTLGAITSPAMVATLSPPTGSYFVQIPVTLTNPAETPLPGWWYYYEVATEKNLELMAAPDASTAVAMPCDSSVTLYPLTSGASATYTCNLVVEVPCGDVPVAVVYTAEGKTAEALLTPSTLPSPSGC